MKILIIDDEPDTVTFLCTWLDDEGYEACAARNSEEGLRAILRERPDLVLLDIKMPGRTGLQLYREIRQHETLSDLPVIFITGMSELQVFDGHCDPLPEPLARIQKPIDLNALRAAIERVNR